MASFQKIRNLSRMVNRENLARPQWRSGSGRVAQGTLLMCGLRRFILPRCCPTCRTSNTRSHFPFPSPFGARISPMTGKQEVHEAIDIACDVGTPVKAALDGTVDLVEESPAGGKTIKLRHSDGFTTAYAHLSRTFVSTGEEVHQNQTIALSGNSGRATTGPHVHFRVSRQGVPVDPLAILENADFQICRL